MKPTEPQRRALQAMFDGQDGCATPSAIGQAMVEGNGRKHYAAQGLGRMGGTMAHRLIKKGWAFHSSRRSGFPAYSITTAGKKALEP